MVNEVDALFGRVERSPFSGDSYNDVTGGEPTVPLDPSGVAQDVGLPLGVGVNAVNGLPNALFIDGPDDGDDSTIDDVDNKLPGWSFDNSNGSNITAVWNNSNDIPQIEFTAASGTLANDYAYIEAIVPVTMIGRILRPAMEASGTTTDAWGYVACQFLKADGTTSGSEVVYKGSLPSASYDMISCWVTPTYGVESFARIRLGMWANANLSGAITTIRKAGLFKPETYDITLVGSRVGLNLASSTDQNFDINDENLTAAVGKFVAQSPGFVMGISGQTDATITGGAATVKLWNATQGAGVDLGGSPVINSLNDKVSIQRLLNIGGNNVLPYDFIFGDEIRPRVSTNGSWNDGVGGDWLITIHVMLVMADSSSYTFAG